MAADAAPAATTEMVTISAARLAELEVEVATLKGRVKKLNHNTLDRLNKYYSENPAEAADRAAERSKKCKAANRDAYNARRRELYRLKKEAAAAAKVADVVTAPVVTPPPVDATK